MHAPDASTAIFSFVASTARALNEGTSPALELTMSSAFTADCRIGKHHEHLLVLSHQLHQFVTAWRRAMTNRRPRVDALLARSLAATLAIVLGLGLPELMARGFLDRSDGAHADLMSRVATRSPAL
jgi:hypothetical protein